MLRTITMATHISVQGEFVRKLDDGQIMIRVGERHFVGSPLATIIRNAVQHSEGATA